MADMRRGQCWAKKAAGRVKRDLGSCTKFRTALTRFGRLETLKFVGFQAGIVFVVQICGGDAERCRLSRPSPSMETGILTSPHPRLSSATPLWLDSFPEDPTDSIIAPGSKQAGARSTRA